MTLRYHDPVLGGTGRCDHDPETARTLLVNEQSGRYGRAELAALAERVGAPSVSRFLDNPTNYLAPFTVSASGRRGRAEPLPTWSHVTFWRDLLPGSPGEAYLRTRGIPLAVAEAARVGWNGRRLTFPMTHRGEIVAAKWRPAKDGARMDALAGKGRDWPLYPPVEPAWRAVLIVAGELDALRARAAGLPACSVTLGAGTWPDAWTGELAGRRVVICFDNNEVEQAEQRVKELRAAGLAARRLDLRTLGLDAEKGDLSDYLNAGGSAGELRRALPPRLVRRSP